MTDQNQSHPTQGRRRRHKSPANLPTAQHLLLPRLLDHILDHISAADGPSDDEEEEKDAKRQRSAPTTPRSTSSIFPRECDEVVGITQVELRSAERFEERDDSDFQDAEETATREIETVKRQNQRSVAWGNPRVIWQCHTARVRQEGSPAGYCCPCCPPLWGRS